jgi:hypothetical protein
MARILGLLLIFGSAICGAAEPGADADGVSLKVKPLLCIIDRRAPACDRSFLVAWQSATTGYYCLFNHFVTTPLRCWNEASAGEHEERRLVDRGFMFWLTENGNDEPLVAVAVEVMTTETTDRRRSRRTRHVWDLL